MGFLVIGAVLVALLVATRADAAPVKAPAPDPKPEPEKSDQQPQSGLGGITDAAKTAAELAGGGGAASMGVIGGGLVLSMVAAEFGKQLTGDDAGAVVGFANWSQGTAFNLGRAGGKEIDRALGGTGKGATGMVAQIGAGTTVLVGTIFGAMASVSMGILGVLVYSVVTIVDDLNRLAFGQAGAWKEFNEGKHGWNSQHQAIAGALLAHAPKLTEERASRFVTPFVDGYMRRVNELNYEQWMRRPRGVGLNDAAHAKFGRDRGYFVGDVGVLDGRLIDTIVPRSSDPEWIAKLDPAETESFVAPRYEIRRVCEKQYPTEAQRMLGIATLPDVCRWERVQVGTETRYRDACQAELMAAGSAAANAAAFAEWMAEPRGLGQSELSHAVTGRNEGRFRSATLQVDAFEWSDNGQVVAKGGKGQVRLVDDGGREWFWKGPDGKPRAIAHPEVE